MKNIQSYDLRFFYQDDLHEYGKQLARALLKMACVGIFSVFEHFESSNLVAAFVTRFVPIKHLDRTIRTFGPTSKFDGPKTSWFLANFCI